jgi:enamine deaminase RidA (YjgF/YER057c/UK114 family)
MKSTITPLLLINFVLTLTSAKVYSQADNTLVQFKNSSSVWSPKGYSHAAIVDLGNARMVIISGQVPFDSVGNLVGKGSMEKQTQQVFLNIKKVLAAAGGDMNNLIKLAYFVTDATQVKAIRDVRDSFINLDQPPTSTLVEVRRLFREEILLEVEATAIIPK